MGGTFLKWLGVGAFLFGVCYLAYRLLFAVGERAKEMEALLRFLRLLLRQIRDYEAPLPKICAIAEEEGLFCPSLWRACEGEGFVCAFDAREAALGMPKEVQSLLHEFFSNLGKSTRTVQIQSCERTLSQLEEQATLFLEELPKKKKLCLTVSVCVGLSTLILLL